ALVVVEAVVVVHAPGAGDVVGAGVGVGPGHRAGGLGAEHRGVLGVREPVVGEGEGGVGVAVGDVLVVGGDLQRGLAHGEGALVVVEAVVRSEERRVGKGGRCRGGLGRCHRG